MPTSCGSSKSGEAQAAGACQPRLSYPPRALASPASPEQILAAWLASRASTPFASLLERYPDQQHELRDLHSHWSRIEPILRLAGFGWNSARNHGSSPEPQRDGEVPGGVGAASGHKPLDDLLSQLRLEGFSSRYKLDAEIGRGGMGSIRRVFDLNLRRHLAMKTMLPARTATATRHSATLARFLAEAQVTSQLDHPGIVPLHELGLDQDGRAYFTMKLVQGRNLAEIYELAIAERESWSETRVLDVLLRVCEALSFAHAKGVVHRDLKPENVMVGDFGEVYVMDWGLARATGRPEQHDLRIVEPFVKSSVHTARRDEREEFPDSPLVTMDGDIFGTPMYMPPEQANGKAGLVSARSDVYAIGAMLYHLLSRRVPFVESGERVSAQVVLQRVREGPPETLIKLRPDVPAELVAIVEKAMAREPEQRYATTLELREDLRAYIEGRVVRAYETGTWAETKKLVRRNKRLAGAVAAAVLSSVIASLAFAGLWQAQRQRADQEQTLTEQAERQAEAADQARREVLSLSAHLQLEELIAEADQLWPARPEMVARYEAWQERAQLLLDGREADPSSGTPRRLSLAEHEQNLKSLGSGLDISTSTGVEVEERWRQDQLARLVAGLRDFTDENRGGLYSRGSSPVHGWGIPLRLEFAGKIEALSVASVDARRRWEDAIDDVARDETYHGLRLRPQTGLLPLGADPRSGLQEFAHLQTGLAPARGDDHELMLTAESGLVLVLIPGGQFEMGPPEEDEPTRPTTVEAFFLSKDEMTQAQWERTNGHNPSVYGQRFYYPHWNRENRPWSAVHPVENVSWNECQAVLPRLDLALPNEAQWEFAARGGESTPWCTGPDSVSLSHAANVRDLYAFSVHKSIGEPEAFDDGEYVHAEVGSYSANRYGLRDVHGNVAEWCADSFDAQGSAAEYRVYRGGSWSTAAEEARLRRRFPRESDARSSSIGVRPARVLE
jgi:serine/threonine protein kinase/formylglycine-generating enzyme required for sulfatase activity